MEIRAVARKAREKFDSLSNECNHFINSLHVIIQIEDFINKKEELLKKCHDLSIELEQIKRALNKPAPSKYDDMLAKLTEYEIAINNCFFDTAKNSKEHFLEVEKRRLEKKYQ